MPKYSGTTGNVHSELPTTSPIEEKLGVCVIADDPCHFLVVTDALFPPAIFLSIDPYSSASHKSQKSSNARMQSSN